MVSPEPLAHGLRLDARPWCSYVASFLSSTIRANGGTRLSTAAAEAGLAVPGSTYSYWYIRRVHHDYNDVVLFHRVDRGELLPGERGGCPFDTGALWSGNTIRTGWTGDDKRTYFARHDRSIAEGLDAFAPWIDRNYGGDITRYDAGERPSTDIPEILAAVVGPSWAPWAWEVRVEKPRVHRVMLPVAIVWRRDSQAQFENWADPDGSAGKAAGLDTVTAQRLRDLVARIELPCEDRESAYDRALRYIREGK